MCVRYYRHWHNRLRAKRYKTILRLVCTSVTEKGFKNIHISREKYREKVNIDMRPGRCDKHPGWNVPTVRYERWTSGAPHTWVFSRIFWPELQAKDQDVQCRREGNPPNLQILLGRWHQKCVPDRHADTENMTELIDAKWFKIFLCLQTVRNCKLFSKELKIKRKLTATGHTGNLLQIRRTANEIIRM